MSQMSDELEALDRIDAFCRARDIDGAKRRLSTLSKAELIALWEHYRRTTLHADERRGFHKGDLVEEVAFYVADDEADDA